MFSRDFPTIGLEFWDEWTWHADFETFRCRCKWTALKILIHHNNPNKTLSLTPPYMAGTLLLPHIRWLNDNGTMRETFWHRASRMKPFSWPIWSRALRDCKVQGRKRMGGCCMLFSSVFLETTWAYCRSLGHHGNQAQMSTFRPHFSSAARISRFTDYTSCIESDVGISVVLLCVYIPPPLTFLCSNIAQLLVDRAISYPPELGIAIVLKLCNSKLRINVSINCVIFNV